MKVTGVFDGWEFDRYHAKHAEKGYSLWIANGFSFFKDDKYQAVPFLTGVPMWTRWKLWRELKWERRQRSLDRVHAMTKESS